MSRGISRHRGRFRHRLKRRPYESGIGTKIASTKLQVEEINIAELCSNNERHVLTNTPTGECVRTHDKDSDDSAHWISRCWKDDLAQSHPVRARWTADRCHCQ